jgi:allophanate hydrolase
VITDAVLQILEPGLGVSVQDLGRRGWKRYGVPPGGAMDRHAAMLANRLVGNPPEAPVLEMLLGGARFRAFRAVEMGLTGATVSGLRSEAWRTFRLGADEEWGVGPPLAGVWSYLAVPGGWAGRRWFGSVSVFPRGGLGAALKAGDLLGRENGGGGGGSALGVGGRWLRPGESRDYSDPPSIPVWPGPQWECFPGAVRSAFFGGTWTVSSRSDRTGYRLEGPALLVDVPAIPSEPVLPGSIQVPPDGGPIITQRDGPTVGGYPKLGLVDPLHLSWVAQHRPGQSIRFVPEGGEWV